MQATPEAKAEANANVRSAPDTRKRRVERSARLVTCHGDQLRVPTAHCKLLHVWRKAHFGSLALALTGACTPGAAPGDDDAVVCPTGLPSDSGCPDSAPSYQNEIQPLVDSYCNGCHYNGNHNSSQVLETYDDLHRSVSLVEKQVYHCEMPPSGEMPLPSRERTALLQWLVCGAPNN